MTKLIDEPNWNGLVPLIVVALLCGLPFGVAAIIQANKAKALFASGDHAEASAKVEKARNFCWVAIIIGVILGSFYFLVTTVEV